MSSSTLALLAALGCALCYGVGSVLEQIGARREATATSIDPRLLWRLAQQLPYLAGLGLDGAGWVLSLVALRTLPLFLVQSAVAASIAVTAVVARLVLRTVLDRVDGIAIVVIVVGLVLLAVAAAPDSSRPVGAGFRAAMLVAVPVLAAAGALLARSSSTRSALGLAAVAGLAFSVTAVAGRTVVIPDPITGVVTEPLAWALVGCGGLGILLFSIALQRGSVTTTNALLFSVETVVPTLIGVVLLGDRARSGRWPLMVIGCVAAIAGSVGPGPARRSRGVDRSRHPRRPRPWPEGGPGRAVTCATMRASNGCRGRRTARPVRGWAWLQHVRGGRSGWQPRSVGILLVAGCGSTSSDAGGRQDTTTVAPPSGPLQILVTNDDGYDAKGIDAVVEALRALPDTQVTVVAPLTNQSGSGGKTTDGPLTATDVKTPSGYPAKAVAGYPADSITWAIDQHGIDFTPDLVVVGHQLRPERRRGRDISGTVGAARAAAARGIPALASSQGLPDPPDYAAGVTQVLELGGHAPARAGVGPGHLTGAAREPQHPHVHVGHAAAARHRADRDRWRSRQLARPGGLHVDGDRSPERPGRVPGRLHRAVDPSPHPAVARSRRRPCRM